MVGSLLLSMGTIQKGTSIIHASIIVLIFNSIFNTIFSIMYNVLQNNMGY